MLIMACYCPARAQAQITTAKIGYVDINYIITRLPETKAAEAELTSLQQQYQKQLDAKVRVFQTRLQSIHNVQFKDSTRRAVEQDLQGMQAEIEKSQQDALAALEQKKTNLATAVLTKVQRAVETISHKEGFDLMLRADNVMYGEAAFDITFPVLVTLGVIVSEAERQQYQKTREPSRP